MPLSSPRDQNSIKDDHASAYGPISLNSLSPNNADAGIFRFFERNREASEVSKRSRNTANEVKPLPLFKIKQ